MSDDLNRVYNCEFTREQLNILSNILVVCYRRGSFQMSELGYLEQVWTHLQNILGESRNTVCEISGDQHHEMPEDVFLKKEDEPVTTVEEVADDMVEKLTTTVEQAVSTTVDCDGDCNNCSCK